jgi:hypothetical protein
VDVARIAFSESFVWLHWQEFGFAKESVQEDFFDIFKYLVDLILHLWL